MATHDGKFTEVGAALIATRVECCRMRYAAIACSACKRVQGVESARTRVRCRGCGSAVEPAAQTALFSSDDERDVQKAVARLAAERAGRPADEIRSLLDEPIGLQAGLAPLLRALGDQGNDFSRQDVAQVAAQLRIAADPERIVGLLVEARLIFEPRPGCLRLL